MTTDEIYISIRELIALLRAGGYEKLSVVLEHRMYKVSWTSSSELLENIASVLLKFIEEQEKDIDQIAADKIRSIIKEIGIIVS